MIFYYRYLKGTKDKLLEKKCKKLFSKDMKYKFKEIYVLMNKVCWKQVTILGKLKQNFKVKK